MKTISVIHTTFTDRERWGREPNEKKRQDPCMNSRGRAPADVGGETPVGVPMEQPATPEETRTPSVLGKYNSHVKCAPNVAGGSDQARLLPARCLLAAPASGVSRQPESAPGSRIS